MAAFTINGVDYQSRLLDGHVQLLITKRLVGVLAVLGTSATSLVEALPRDGKFDLDDIEGAAQALQPIATEISKLSDADVDYIFDACMKVTQRRLDVGAGWAHVVQNGIVQHASDGAFSARLQITWNVLQENFSQIGGMIGLSTAQKPGLIDDAAGNA